MKRSGREKDRGDSANGDGTRDTGNGPPEEEEEVVEAEIIPDEEDEDEVEPEIVSAEGGPGRGGEVPAGGAGELQEKNAELLSALQRLQADFENYRKRMLREQTHILENAEAQLTGKLLPVIDNLERALENADKEESRGLYEGVEMVLNQLMEILAREGLEVVDPEGEPFDPEHQEAMMVVETEECPEDTVLEVVQKGYLFNGRLLRPAMVKVSCAVRG